MYTVERAFKSGDQRGGSGGGQSRYVWILKCDKAVNFMICGRSLSAGDE